MAAFNSKPHSPIFLDFRLSTLPTHWGEKAVLRLQQNKPVQLSFAELGMTQNQQNPISTCTQPTTRFNSCDGTNGEAEKSISLLYRTSMAQYAR